MLKLGKGPKSKISQAMNRNGAKDGICSKKSDRLEIRIQL